jgi:hypothetical protein
MKNQRLFINFIQIVGFRKFRSSSIKITGDSYRKEKAKKLDGEKEGK